MNRFVLSALSAVAAVAVTVGSAAAASPTLDSVKNRGQLVCGVSTGLAGFAAPDDKGVYKGFDVDYCRAMSAAVLAILIRSLISL
jgi:general L-amino acid transport system substrate-binding protein